MRWNSVRTRLTLWNVGIMALVLAGFGLALNYTVRASLSRAIDADLTAGGRFYARWAERRRLPPPGFPGQFPGAERPSPAPLPPPEHVPGESAGELPTHARRLFRREPPNDPDDPDHRGYYRRPRVLDTEGNSIRFPYTADEPWDPDTFMLSVAGKDYFSTIIVGNEMVRVFSTPIWRRGRVEGVVQVAHLLTESRKLNTRLVGTLVTLIPIALLVAGLGGAFLTERALRPVREVTQAAAQIGAEDLSDRLKVTGDDELSDLARTFNGMIARLETAFHSLEAAYEQQRRFTGDASHELRTPLTTIKANTSLALAGECTPEDYREALRAADEAADTMNRIVQDLLLLARSDSGHLDMQMDFVPVEAILRGAVAVVRDRESAEMSVEVPASALGIRGDRHHLVRLFVNLVENAVRHTPPEGRVTLSAVDAGEVVELRVEDTGEGIAPEHVPHLCERFYRVDSARSRARGGTGLGLAICRSIVNAHGGTLSFESEVGRGTTVTVILPKAALPIEAANPEPSLA